MERDCRECGEEIDERRLKAKPEAVLCINCQMDLERKGHFRLHRLDVQATLKAGEVDTVESRLVRGTVG